MAESDVPAGDEEVLTSGEVDADIDEAELGFENDEDDSEAEETDALLSNELLAKEEDCFVVPYKQWSEEDLFLLIQLRTQVFAKKFKKNQKAAHNLAKYWRSIQIQMHRQSEKANAAGKTEPPQLKYKWFPHKDVKTKWNYLCSNWQSKHKIAEKSGEGRIKWKFYDCLKDYFLCKEKVKPRHLLVSGGAADERLIENSLKDGGGEQTKSSIAGSNNSRSTSVKTKHKRVFSETDTSPALGSSLPLFGCSTDSDNGTTKRRRTSAAMIQSSLNDMAAEDRSTMEQFGKSIQSGFSSMGNSVEKAFSAFGGTNTTNQKLDTLCAKFDGIQESLCTLIDLQKRSLQSQNSYPAGLFDADHQIL